MRVDIGISWDLHRSPPAVSGVAKVAGMKVGDTIVVVQWHGEVLGEATLEKTTVAGVVQAIKKALQVRLGNDSETCDLVYEVVAGFRDSAKRRALINRYEDKKLVSADLLGDRYQFTGVLTSKGHVWTCEVE